jgi:O-succinylbenzoic acid--CoA ligase
LTSDAEALVWPGAHASRPFLRTATQCWSHAEVAAQAQAHLARVPAAERVLIAGRGGMHLVPALLAAWAHGALVLLVDPRESAAEIERIAASARAVVWHPEPALRLSNAPEAILRFDCARPAVALRTSGSTGTPKFAVHALRSLVANARAANARVGFGSDDGWLLSLAPHHVGGLSILVRAMLAGGCVVLGDGPGALAADLRAERAITHVSVVATQLRRLLDDPGLDRRVRSLRAILLGGGPTPAAWREEALDRGWPLFVTYGLTECASQVTTARASRSDESVKADDVVSASTDAGTPLDGVGVRIGGDGEIVVSGPTVFIGYLDAPPLAEPSFATGDLGVVDAHGRLHVTGRRDAMFITGGENVQPEEIENVLRSVPGIEAAAVIAVEDPVWQWRPIAFVAGRFERDALEAALARLPRFKWPDRMLEMPAGERERAKPRRSVLAASLDAPTLWTRDGR